MALKENEYLTPGRDHSYDVQSGTVELVSAMYQQPVSYSEKHDTYFEYAGDEYLEGDEVKVIAPVLDDN